MRAGEVLLEVVRNEMVESIHNGHLLILDSSGNDLLKLGYVDELIYPRSAVKSLQASAMLRAGLKLTGPRRIESATSRCAWLPAWLAHASAN